MKQPNYTTTCYNQFSSMPHHMLISAAAEVDPTSHLFEMDHSKTLSRSRLSTMIKCKVDLYKFVNGLEISSITALLTLNQPASKTVEE